MTKQGVMCDKHVAPFTVSTSTLNGLGSWSWSFYVKEMMLRGDKTQMVLGNVLYLHP